MASKPWRDHRRIAVAAASSVSFLPTWPFTPLERLTIWANSGFRTLTSVTFQPQINGHNFGPAVSVVGRPANDVVLWSGGAVAENLLYPFLRPGEAIATIDPFDLSILITNNDGANDITVSMMANGLEHTGG